MTKAKALGITKFPYIEYDSKGEVSYYEDSTGYWDKFKKDSKGNKIYWETFAQGK